MDISYKKVGKVATTNGSRIADTTRHYLLTTSPNEQINLKFY